MSAPAVEGPEEGCTYRRSGDLYLEVRLALFGAEGVAVDQHEKWCKASLSVPGVPGFGLLMLSPSLTRGPVLRTCLLVRKQHDVDPTREA